jgi:aspartyl-tRNA(Asn)/glutamyl-tRNA(Gln) amidotransferase subunit C
MRLGDDELAHLARLARLRLDPEEAPGLQADVEAVLAHLGALADVDVDGLEPMLRPLQVEDGLRTDRVQTGLDPERARNLAQARQDGFIRVARTGGDDG